MGKKSLAVVVTIAFGFLGVLGAYLLKRASDGQNPTVSSEYRPSYWTLVVEVVY
jgi:hypothetical protein